MNKQMQAAYDVMSEWLEDEHELGKKTRSDGMCRGI